MDNSDVDSCASTSGCVVSDAQKLDGVIAGASVQSKSIISNLESVFDAASLTRHEFDELEAIDKCAGGFLLPMDRAAARRCNRCTYAAVSWHVYGAIKNSCDSNGGSAQLDQEACQPSPGLVDTYLREFPTT
jgi:hypothetical protein